MVELAAVGGSVVAVGDTGAVVTAEVVAGAFGGFVWGAGRLTDGGAPGRSVAFGFRDSTRVFSRFTWSIRSCRWFPSFMDCTVLLTSAS